MTWAKPAARVKQWDGPAPTPRVTLASIADHRAALVLPRPKEAPARSEQYLRLVAAMPCCHCGQVGSSQAAHADEGKGMGMKADDRTAIPLCADSPGRHGCHWLIGTSGRFNREQRRQIERTRAQETRAKIMADGMWPENLPRWVDVREANE